MIKNGYVYENLMINLKGSNTKLAGRQVRIVSEALGISEEKAEQLLNDNDRVIRKAIEAYKA